MWAGLTLLAKLHTQSCYQPASVKINWNQGHTYA